MADSPVRLHVFEDGSFTGLVIGCDLCKRWTRVYNGVEGARYPYHKPGCPKTNEYLPAEVRHFPAPQRVDPDA